MTLKNSGSLALSTGARAFGALRGAARCAGLAAQAARRGIARLSGAGWAFADQCTVSLANFVTIYLFARYLESPVFGAYILAYTGLLLMTNLQGALVVQPHNILAAGLPRAEYRAFTGALALLQALYCVAIAAVLGASGWLLVATGAPGAGGVLLALAAAAVPWMGQEFVRRVLYTRGQARAAAMNDAITYGLQVLGAVMLIQTAGPGVTPGAALSVLGLSSVAGVLAGLWQLREHVSFAQAGRASVLRAWSEAWSFGRWLTAQNGLAWFGAQGHAWVVGLLLGVEQVGLYRAATHLVNVMNPVLQAAFSYLPSRGSLAYTAGGAPGLARWVKTTLWVLLLLLLPICAVLVGFPDAVLRLAYGERFEGTPLPLILALAAAAQFIGFAKYPFDLGLMALRSTKSIFFAYLIPVVLLLTAGTALIHFLGIVGVPISGLLINAALLVATGLAYRRRMREQKEESAADESRSNEFSRS